MNLIVCGYGGSASAMASFANQMLNTGFIKAVDIYGSLDQSALQKRLLKAVSAERERSIVMCGIGLSGALRRILEKTAVSRRSSCRYSTPCSCLSARV